MYRVSEFVISCRQVKVAGEVCGSLLARSNRNAYIMARWSTGTAINTSITSPRPGVVLFYCIVNVLVKSSRLDTTIRTETRQHILCKVNWFFQHELHRYYGYPVEVWSEHFYPLHMYSGSYMPVFRITSHCATGTVQAIFSGSSEETVQIVCQ